MIHSKRDSILRNALLLVILTCAACNNNRHKPLPVLQNGDLIKKMIGLKSPLLTNTYFDLKEKSDSNKEQVDSLVLAKLHRSDIFPLLKPGEDIWSGKMYSVCYYGYLNSKGKNYTPVIFLKSTVTDCGQLELILVHFSSDGNLVDALPIALYTSPAECLITTTAAINGNEITTLAKEECDDGRDEDTRDSTTTKYIISDSGKFAQIYSSKK